MTTDATTSVLKLPARKHVGARSRACFSLVLACFAAIPLPALSHAQTASEYQIKAAYLYNFAKATKWPDQALLQADSTLVVSVFGGDDDFVQVLRNMLLAKTINGHPVKVTHASTAAELKSSHLAFFRGYDPRNSSAIRGLVGANVLLVGEDPNFLQQGGMINLVLRDGRVSFEVNPVAMEKAGIRYGESAATPDRNASGFKIDSGSRAVANRVTPVYPEIAQRMSLQGTVQLQATVRADGTVRDVRVVGGHPMLAAAAQQAVRMWRFQPAAKETVENVKITFGD